MCCGCDSRVTRTDGGGESLFELLYRDPFVTHRDALTSEVGYWEGLSLGGTAMVRPGLWDEEFESILGRNRGERGVSDLLSIANVR